MSFLGAFGLGSKSSARDKLSLSEKLSDPEEALVPKEKCALQQLPCCWLLSILPVVMGGGVIWLARSVLLGMQAYLKVCIQGPRGCHAVCILHATAAW